MPSRIRGKGRAPEVVPEATLPLGKQLAHTDKKIRDQAMANLGAFLSGGGILSLSGKTGGEDVVRAGKDDGSKRLLPPLEMRKLWKGLFYCFWMSDKPLVQQRLASDLSSLMLSIEPVNDGSTEGIDSKTNAGLDFVAGFWEALVREWTGIDRLRMDKYYMLIRRWQNATFRLLARSGWAPEAVKRYNEILTAAIGGPLSTKDLKVSPSISWHLADIWLEELNKVVAEETETPAPLADIVEPFIRLLTCTSNPATPKRLREAMFQPLIAGLLPSEESEQPAKKKRRIEEGSHEIDNQFPELATRCSVGSGEKTVATERELANSVLKRMMALASLSNEEGVKDSNRRKVYEFVREWGGIDDEDDDE